MSAHVDLADRESVRRCHESDLQRNYLCKSRTSAGQHFSKPLFLLKC